MYKAISGRRSFDIKKDNDTIFLENHILNWDIVKLDDRNFHIIYEHKSYHVEVVELNQTSKIVKLKVNGNLHEVEVKDKMDLLLEKMGLSNLATAALTDIKAPMPGLILHIYTTEGEEVKKGDPIMILEAMKMENIIKSSGDGTVKSVLVKKGESVEKNQILINFV